MTLWDEVKEFGKGMYDAASAPFKITKDGVKSGIEKTRDTTFKVLDKSLKFGLPAATIAGWTGWALGMWDVDTVKEGIALGSATAATSYGTYAYLAGKYPFVEIGDNEYIITQWINESKGPVLKGPGTSWLVKPLIKEAQDQTGMSARVSGISRPRDVKGCDFITKMGIAGTFDAQYIFRIDSPKDASKFYWELRKNPEALDELVGGAIASEFNSSTWQEITHIMDHNDYKDIVDRINNGVPGSLQGGMKDKYGATIKDLSILKFNVNDDSQRVIRRPFEEQQDSLAKQYRAEQLAKNQKLYYQQAEELLTDPSTGKLKEGYTNQHVYDLANQIADRANNEAVAEEGGRVYKFSPNMGFGGPMPEGDESSS